MTGFGFNSSEYGKAALGYLALKDLLGEELFKSSLREFMARWNGKHTLPWDMFNSFNSASGKDLNWFFNNWYFSNGYIDLAIQDVTPSTAGYTLTIKNIGGFAVPVNVVATYNDGSAEIFHQTPAIWAADQKQAVVQINTQKKIRALTLDGGIFMDADETNNKWQQK